ncbi:MAG: hypothetical protein JNK23_03625 [Opitutaceae bacterium]|nr:hypothetical protein [Opitutaceae bacterium]
MRIGLDAWIIQDGNYPDFSVGDVRCFALEFYAKNFSIRGEGVSRCTLRKGCDYDLSARITFKKDNLTVIDFGHLAYSEQGIAADVGVWIDGDFFVGIDPFMYSENWERSPNIPKIKCEWRIDRIFRQTTPLIEEKPRYFVRDETRFSEIEIDRTNAWEDDNGNASYALECSKVGAV